MPATENVFSPGMTERLGWMLIHVLWQATVIAALLALTLRRLRHAGANLRYVVACSALALMVAMPVVTLRLIEAPGPVAEAGPPLVPVAMAPAMPAPAIETIMDHVHHVGWASAHAESLSLDNEGERGISVVDREEKVESPLFLCKLARPVVPQSPARTIDNSPPF